ncbi:MAG: DNA gyrase subunit A [Candidatus Schekmanbacteria bacterium]|nr:DNA gyrase subunit A [Candidatus Schekmanbacteria bacterium]
MQDTRKIPVNIEDEMKKSYIDYAMSVIVGRALPDVRDGLKPVHRRILYAMHDLGLLWNKPYKKSARVVGEVLGKYHPHGDIAVYDALTRMVQDFSLRYPLIAGQGNFGSMDGDAPAAMRYTEVRLAGITEQMLLDLDKETVDFAPNFDESLEEPTVLPAKLPNLLINGSSGIAVGMATNIPPHNLGEVIDGLVMLIDNPQTTIPELMQAIKGPDFPTGAYIYGYQGIRDAYTTGKGLIQVRANAVVEEKKEKTRIVVSEIPYQVNKAKLVEKIAELVKEKRLEGISDLRDESDREGTRIVIELKRNEIAQVILNNLYKLTQMQTTFGVIMLAIVDKRPCILNLKDTLVLYLKHRREVVERRTNYELKKAEERLHILEGLKIALDNLDAVIALIKKSASPAIAKQGLMDTFALSALQSQAILEMRLQRLTALEQDKIHEEHKELLMLIARLQAILGSDNLLMNLIKEELIEVKERYDNPRRTVIIPEEADLKLEDLIVDEEAVVIITRQGYVKRNPLRLYRLQKRSGHGAKGVTTKETDFVEHLFVCSTHAYLLFFSDAGRIYWLKVHAIPEASRQAKGTAIINLLPLSEGEKISAVIPIKEFSPDKYIIMCTKSGIIKKSRLDEYSRPRPAGIIAINLEENDRLISVQLSNGKQDIFIATRFGLSIRFKEEDVRSIGRVGRGVQGIRLSPRDEVIGMEVTEPQTTILTVTEFGYGKQTELAKYPVIRRGGKGVINLRITPKTGDIIGIQQTALEDTIMLITANGTLIWMAVKEISTIGRNTQGVKLQNLDEGDKVVAIAQLAEPEVEVEKEEE